MKDTTKQEIDQILKEWKARDNYTNNFVLDGIINHELYNKSKPRILFLLKEPNDPNGKGWDIRTEFTPQNMHRFVKTLSTWAHGIFCHYNGEDFPVWNDFSFDTAFSSFEKGAIMNIKKTGGKGSSDLNDLKGYVESHIGLINKQIEAINPQIIITGLSWPALRDKVFPNASWENTGFDIDYVIDEKGRCIIDYYHPSSRIPMPVTYAFLEKILRTIPIKF